MNPIKYQLLKIHIASKNETVKFSAESDNKYERINGLFMSLPQEEALLSSTMELRISDEEVFPEDFEIKLLTSGQQVSPNDRFYDRVDHEAMGSMIEGRFVDGGKAVLYPYTAVLYLRLENPPQDESPKA